MCNIPKLHKLCCITNNCRVEEETQQAFGNDVLLLSGGYVLTFIYFALFLGKFNRREFKVCKRFLSKN